MMSHKTKRMMVDGKRPLQGLSRLCTTDLNIAKVPPIMVQDDGPKNGDHVDYNR